MAKTLPSIRYFSESSMSLKPSIANPQRHLPASSKAQAPRSRGAGNHKIPNDPELKNTLNQSPETNDEHSGSLITVLIAVGANLVIAIAKTVAAFMTGSASMIAEAAHSWADAGNGTLLIVAEKKSIKPADKSHPLGYGKESYVWSMIAALVYLRQAQLSLFIQVSRNGVLLSLKLTIRLVLLYWQWRLCSKESHWFSRYRQSKKHGEALDISALGYVVDTSNPTLRGVFFEDLAAVIGLVIAAAAMGMHAYTGEPYWDALGSIIVGLLLGIVAIFLISRNREFLVGHRVTDRMHEYVLSELLDHPDMDTCVLSALRWIGPKKIFMGGGDDIAGNQKEGISLRSLKRLKIYLEAIQSFKRLS